jgi:hypothetical protein
VILQEIVRRRSVFPTLVSRGRVAGCPQSALLVSDHADIFPSNPKGGYHKALPGNFVKLKREFIRFSIQVYYTYVHLIAQQDIVIIHSVAT